MKALLLTTCLLALAEPVAAQPCPQGGDDAPLALHKSWIMDGWERRQGDPTFVFAKKMSRYYDVHAPRGVFYDNFAPGASQLFDNAAVYGTNWEDLQNGARSVLHALTGGDDQIAGDNVASTTIGFVGRISRLDGKVVAFDGRSQLGWACIDGAWKIRQELNYARVVKPEDIAHYYRQKAEGK